MKTGPMDANFTLFPEAVGIVKADSKASILAAVAERFAHAYGVDAAKVLESLEEREALGSTGFGRGVAIPHARNETIKRPMAVLLKLEAAVDFGSADGMDVNVVFGLLSPENCGVGHLHALAAISRIVREELILESINEAQSPEAIFGLLTNAVDRNVA